jgi:hypothetical protein
LSATRFFHQAGGTPQNHLDVGRILMRYYDILSDGGVTRENAPTTGPSNLAYCASSQSSSRPRELR